MAFRAALHQAGAAALSQLLQFPEPAADQRTIPCPCGSQAHYRELRSRRILTALGEVELTRPWYLCPRCHNGQFPVDRQLDIENRDCSPGVRRMDAMVGQQGPFDRGREQMKVLAGLEVTAKSVERTAEAIGAEIAAREQREIRKAVQLDLPIVVGEPIPDSVCADGRDWRAGSEKETEGRKGKTTASRPIRAKPNWDACSLRPAGTRKDSPFAIRIPPLIPGPSKRPKSLAGASIWKPGTAAGAARKRKLSWATGPSGSGILPTQHFPGAVQIVDLYHARQHLWELARKLYPNDECRPEPWMKVHQKRLLDNGKIKKLVARFAPF